MRIDPGCKVHWLVLADVDRSYHLRSDGTLPSTLSRMSLRGLSVNFAVACIALGIKADVTVDDTEDDDDWLPHYWDASSAGALANYPVHKALTTSNNKHFIVVR